MWLDRFTADDDFWYFCKRFTSYSTYKISERGHPMDGGLWIDHPYTFWLCRLYQELIVEPQEGWTWIKIHRLGLKTTTALALCLWVHSIDREAGDYPRWLGLEQTIGLWTHKVEKIGTGMGRGALAMLQTSRLRDHYPQFRELQEGTKQGYTVGRPSGAREQSLTIESILTSPESLHPGIYLLDDIITGRLRNNMDQIARIRKNISDIVSLMPPDAPVIVFNTPKDKADPLMERERDGLFSRVITQAATLGGDFTPAGQPNLHTARHYKEKRRLQADDSVYFAEFELEFRERVGTLFSWSWMREYDQRPEEIAAASPYINIIIDGAGGTKGSDFTVIRVITWTAHNAWANLDLIRERIGSSKTMQILLGRDRDDPTTEWIERPVMDSWRPYCPGGVGLVERWLLYDPHLTLWFDDHGNANWRETFLDQCRLRRINFGGKMPTVRAWPEIHMTRDTANDKKQKRSGFTKYAKIRALEPAYQQGRAAYPRAGFGHGSFNGLAGFDKRDTLEQFRYDEFERLTLGEQLAFDDLLDTESLLVLPQAYLQMRRPAEGSSYEFGGRSFAACTVDSPWGLPGGPNYGTINTVNNGRTWVSIL